MFIAGLTNTSDISGIITIIILLLFALFILLQMYIARLKRSLLHARDFSKSIIENAKTAIIVCNDDGTVIMFNEYAQEVSCYSASEAVGKKVCEIPFLNDGTDIGRLIYGFVTGMTDTGESQKIIQLISEPKENLMSNYETYLKSKDGKSVYIIWNVYLVRDEEKKSVNIVAMGTDITEMKSAEFRLAQSYWDLESAHEELMITEEEIKKQYDDLKQRDIDLKRSEERYRLAVEGVNDGIWDWDGSDKKLFMSKRCRQIMGFSSKNDYITLDMWFSIILREDLDKFIRSYNKYMASPQDYHFQIEYRINTADEKIKWIRTRGMAIWDENGTPIRVAGSNTDITEQKLADEKIHQLAYYDSMTGLPNRALLMDRFIIAAASAKRKGRMVGVFFLDLDNFKTINDTIGHSFGDQLLFRVGKQLKSKMRKSDTIARLGGDEFIMLQANVKDIEEINQFAKRVLELFKQSWVLDEREFCVTASMGISVYPKDGSNLQELMKNADTAMYRAKETGKNNFEIYTQELNSRILERLEIENCLRKASDKGEFILYYQPQIELNTGRIRGMEALIRWSSPFLGWISPDAFIYIAEEIGVINIIGEWVLRSACTQLGRWHSEGFDDLKISVNLSSRQFQQINLLDMLIEIIRDTGIKAEWLELEITESVIMQDLEHNISVLKSIKELGIGISLDDFGKGYSSLNYLKILPIDNLKIDQTFVHDITKSSSQAKVASALISLAHSLDLTVTAEGVEETGQLELLASVGCDIMQGFLFSKPKPADELEPSEIFYETHDLLSTNHLSSSSHR